MVIRVSSVVIGFLVFIALLGVRASAQEAPDAAPPLSPDDPASSHFMLEQRPLPGSIGGGTGMGKGRVGPGSAPVPDSVVAEYLDSGQYEELARLFRERLAFLDVTAPGRDPRIATALKNLGLVYQLQARFDDAAALYERALEQHRRLDGDQSAAVALAASQLATVYQALGRLQEAERLHLEAVAIFKQSRAPQHLDVGLSLNNLAHLYVGQRRIAEARKLFRRALAIFEAARGPIHSDVALAHTNLALCAKLVGDKSEALGHFTRAIEIFTALGRGRPELAVARDNLASFLAERGSWKEALSEADQASDIIIKQAQRGVFHTTASGDANAAAVPWNQAALARYVKAAWEVSRTDRGADAALREKAFRRAQWISQTSTAKALADMAARQAKGDTPLAALARRRQDLMTEWRRLDRQLLDAITRQSAERDRAGEQKLRNRLDEIAKILDSIDRALAQDFPDYAALASPRPLTILEVQSLLADDEALVLFQDTRAALGADGETFIWLITNKQSQWHVAKMPMPHGGAPKTANVLRDHVDALRCGLDVVSAWRGTRCFDLLGLVYTEEDRLGGTPAPFRLETAHRLYQGLFANIEEAIKGKHLILVPTGPLTQLPFQVLVTKSPANDRIRRLTFRDASWLIKDHAITVLPSVSALAALRRFSGPSRASKPFIGFANPLLDGNPSLESDRLAADLARTIAGCSASGERLTVTRRKLHEAVVPLAGGNKPIDASLVRRQSPLPETADEVCNVARSLGGLDAVNLGRQATESRLKALSANGELARYRILHLATHGALAGELDGGREPGLILTPPKQSSREDDGYLSASEIAGLKLNADWIILSACNTAAGATDEAEALSGLAKAFFYAGARSLLVSHWYVDSAATVALITGAARAMSYDANIGRSEAMRQAMLELITSGGPFWHPSYWAPFVVVGEGAGTR